jgi:hypothetical protein
LGKVDPRWHDLMDRSAGCIDAVVEAVKPGEPMSRIQEVADAYTDAGGQSLESAGEHRDIDAASNSVGAGSQTGRRITGSPRAIPEHLRPRATTRCSVKAPSGGSYLPYFRTRGHTRSSHFVFSSASCHASCTIREISSEAIGRPVSNPIADVRVSERE